MVPRFEPFAALRYAAGPLADVVAPPYDVLSEDDVSEYQGRSAYNISHVDVPRGGADRYARAADLLQRWRRDGVLVCDPQPSFTISRPPSTPATSRGVPLASVNRRR